MRSNAQPAAWLASCCGVVRRRRGSRPQDRLHRPAFRRRRQRRDQCPETHDLPGRQGQRRRGPERGTAATALLRQQGRSAGVADRAQESARRWRALHLPGQRQRGGARHHRRRCQVQRAQSGPGSAVLQLRGHRPGADQRQVQFLAFPLRRRRRHENGRAGERHRDATADQEGVSHQSGLLVRQGGRRSGAAHARRKAPRHHDRRRRIASAAEGAGFFALCRQNQGLGRGHGDHRQLEQRHAAADQGRQGRRAQGQLVYLLCGEPRLRPARSAATASAW